MLEAMAAGLPIVASDLPAHRDLVRHGGTGWLVDHPAALDAALSAAEDPAVNRQTGQAAKAWIRQEVGTWSDSAARYHAAYEVLLKPNRANTNLRTDNTCRSLNKNDEHFTLLAVHELSSNTARPPMSSPDSSLEAYLGRHLQQTDSTPSGVCAVIVAYHPDQGLEERLKQLLPQVDALIVVDNTPEDRRVSRIKLPQTDAIKLLLIENRENKGVAAALNQGLDQALLWKCGWLLTLDQDTRCLPGMVSSLLAIDAGASTRPVVIGSNYFDPRNNATKVPPGMDGCIDQKTVITSGTLVNVSFARAIGGFRKDYFIDQIDHEFCLRARSRGGRVVISRKPLMEHSVGEPGGVWLPLIGRLPNHTPQRKYYVARNSLVTIGLYWQSEFDWCLRRIIRLILSMPLMVALESQGLEKLSAFAAGVADALTRRMGPCDRNIDPPI
jgi:rhamnosyltransferase